MDIFEGLFLAYHSVFETLPEDSRLWAAAATRQGPVTGLTPAARRQKEDGAASASAA